jgi:hypothetical protein
MDNEAAEEGCAMTRLQGLMRHAAGTLGVIIIISAGSDLVESGITLWRGFLFLLGAANVWLAAHALAREEHEGEPY